MSIGSIGSIGALQSTPPIDPAIKAQLDALGLQPTGSRESDLAAIQAALAKQNSDSSNSTSSSNTNNTSSSNSESKKSQHGGPPPWASLMQELGISPTGSKDGDFSAISEAISNLQSQAKTDADKAKVASYQSEFDTINSQAESTPFSAEQNQTAAVNKFFMVNQN